MLATRPQVGPRRPRAPALALLLQVAAAAPALAVQQPVPEATAPALDDGRDDARALLLELVNRERQELGLEPLVLDPALSRAAQAHADDMTHHEYFGFTSPDGTQIEAWVHREGYRARLVTEKLAHADLPLPELVADWGRHADRNRRSVFHPEVRDLGVGFGDYLGVPVYALALAQSQEDFGIERLLPGADRQGPPEATDLTELAERAAVELVERLNAARGEAGRAPLRHDPTLDRIARSRAEEVGAPGSDAKPSPGSRNLYARALSAGYRPDLRRGVAEIVARGPLCAAEVVVALLESADYRESLFSSFFLEIGVGVRPGGDREGEAVWVLWLGRPRL